MLLLRSCTCLTWEFLPNINSKSKFKKFNPRHLSTERTIILQWTLEDLGVTVWPPFTWFRINYLATIQRVKQVSGLQKGILRHGIGRCRSWSFPYFKHWLTLRNGFVLNSCGRNFFWKKRCHIFGLCIPNRICRSVSNCKGSTETTVHMEFSKFVSVFSCKNILPAIQR